MMNASSIAICPPRFLPGRLTRARVPFRPLLVVAPHNNNALSACVTACHHHRELNQRVNEHG
jgi:hypothetical protein